VAARAVRPAKAHSYLLEIRINLARAKKHLLEIENTMIVLYHIKIAAIICTCMDTLVVVISTLTRR